MKLTPDEDKDMPSRTAFTGVGSSRPSLCDSPVDEHLDFRDETNNVTGSGNTTEDHKGVGRSLVPMDSGLGLVEDKEYSDNDNDHHNDDHHDDVDVKMVSTPNQGDGDVGNDIMTRLEHSKHGDGDAEMERTESRIIENDIKDDVDDDTGQTSQSKDDLVDDSARSGASEDKGPRPNQEDENDTVGDHQHAESICHPTNEPSPNNSATSLKGSISSDPQQSSTPLHSRVPSQQGSSRSLRSSTSRRQGSSRSLRSSTSKRHGETSRRSSGSSRRTINSRRSSSASSVSATSSSGSSSGSNSSSSSSDSNSDSDSGSSSASSSSYSSSDSNSSSSGSQSSSSGSDSDSTSSSSSSSDSEADSDANADHTYLLPSEKYERTSRRGSGPSSSFSFSPDGYDMNRKRKDKKSRGKRSRKIEKPELDLYATSTHAQRRRYEERNMGEDYQETCSSVCVIL